VKFGVGLAPFDRWPRYDEMAEAVAFAEEVGFDYIYMPDHVMVPWESVAELHDRLSWFAEAVIAPGAAGSRSKS
jgi:alkanesulfonate monooxygenase SsuD/methylene tetrahydromethanopterin reductase-like flavin-dependent oxidoreductase (luciferase family)